MAALLTAVAGLACYVAVTMALMRKENRGGER